MDNDRHWHEHINENNEDELVALIKYMINHNTSHTNELSDLADKLGGKNEGEAYDFVKGAISDFKAANQKLSLALEAIVRR